jgi:acetylornithine/succinyldiaminopimelate/putrescine aminotransferase
LAAAAARAVLAIMEREGVPERAAAAGARLTSALEALDGVSVVRGRGLLLAAELTNANAGEVVARALENGVVVNAVTPTALRLAPPLLIEDADIDLGVARIAKAIGESG